MLVGAVAALGASCVAVLDYSAPAIVEAISLPHSESVEFVTADIMI